MITNIVAKVHFIIVAKKPIRPLKSGDTSGTNASDSPELTSQNKQNFQNGDPEFKRSSMASEIDGLSLNRLLLTQGSPSLPKPSKPNDPHSQLLLMPNGPIEGELSPLQLKQQKAERRIDDVFKQYARHTSLDGPVLNTSPTRSTQPKNVHVNPPVPALVTQTSIASGFSSSGGSSSRSDSLSTPNGPVRNELEEKVRLRKAHNNTESSASPQRQQQQSPQAPKTSTASAARPQAPQQPPAPPIPPHGTRRQTISDIAEDVDLQKLLVNKPHVTVSAQIIAPEATKANGSDGNHAAIRSIAQLTHRSPAQAPSTYGYTTLGRPVAPSNQLEKSGRRGSEPDINKVLELQKYRVDYCIHELNG